METFWQRGYHGTSMRDLVRAMEISPQSIYDTFGGKRVLFLKSLERYERQASEKVKTILEQDDAGHQGIVALIALWQDQASQRPFKGCLIQRAAAEVGGEWLQVADLARNHYITLAQSIASRLNFGESQAQTVAQHLVAVCQGMIALANAGVSPSVIQSLARSAVGLLDP